MIEHFFTCPYCWQQISMVIDPYLEDEEYIEDCYVCCRPIVVNFRLSNDEIVSFSGKQIDGNS